jgi:hypothetical protein
MQTDAVCAAPIVCLSDEVLSQLGVELTLAIRAACTPTVFDVAHCGQRAIQVSVIAAAPIGFPARRR